jgi:hypothetical protein
MCVLPVVQQQQLTRGSSSHERVLLEVPTRVSPGSHQVLQWLLCVFARYKI